MDIYSSFNSRKYSTLLHRINTSPNVPLELPSCISSVFANFWVSASTYLEVHIIVGTNKESLVLQAPLKTDDHLFAYLLLQKRLGVERNILQALVGAGMTYWHRQGTVVTKVALFASRDAHPHLSFYHVAPRVIAAWAILPPSAHSLFRCRQGGVRPSGTSCTLYATHAGQFGRCGGRWHAAREPP